MILQIWKSQNGWIVISGDASPLYRKDVALAVQSFNSLDKAISSIRKELRTWHVGEPVTGNPATK